MYSGVCVCVCVCVCVSVSVSVSVCCCQAFVWQSLHWSYSATTHCSVFQQHFKPGMLHCSFYCYVYVITLWIKQRDTWMLTIIHCAFPVSPKCIDSICTDDMLLRLSRVWAEETQSKCSVSTVWKLPSGLRPYLWLIQIWLSALIESKFLIPGIQFIYTGVHSDPLDYCCKTIYW